MATAKEKREERERANQAANQEFMQNPGAIAAAHGEVAKPQSAGAKVTIACKLGIAWVDLQLSLMVEKEQQTQTGIRMVKEAVRTGRIVRIRGTAYPRGTTPDGFPARPVIIGGAAMNPGVDKDFWDEWKDQNRLNPLVINGMIFAHESEEQVFGRAREEVSNVSGLEPINPRDDARMPRSTRRGELDDIETEEGRARKAVIG